MTSSVVRNIFYNEKAATLRVYFVGGAIYEYRKVPVAVYKAMELAPSKGVYFNAIIKGHYVFRKIG